jgi:hypothetical protein
LPCRRGERRARFPLLDEDERWRQDAAETIPQVDLGVRFSNADSTTASGGRLFGR